MQMQEGGEEMMTKNAVQQIEEAEHKAKEYQALAVEQAKKLLSDADRQGKPHWSRRSVRRRRRGGNRIHKRNKLRSFVQTRL